SDGHADQTEDDVGPEPAGDVNIAAVEAPLAVDGEAAAEQQEEHADPDDRSPDEAGAGEDVELLLAAQILDGDGQDQLEKQSAADDERGADDVQPAGDGKDDVVKPVGHAVSLGRSRGR